MDERYFENVNLKANDNFRFFWLPLMAMALIGSMAVLSGCRQEEKSSSVNSLFSDMSPIVVFGVDGLEWGILLPMLKEGRLPNYTNLMNRGLYGKLRTFVPTFSPVVWTTIATGKHHSKHGIQHFARRLPNGTVTLYDSSDRTTKAIWNILSDYDRRVATIGWWMTYPVEPIHGVMVAQTNTVAQLDTRAGKHIWKGTLLKGVPKQVFPQERQNEMMSVLETVDRTLPELTTKVFGTFAFQRSLLGERLWNNCQWAFRADATYMQIALQLATERPLPDLTLVYLGGPDVVGHRFWRYMQPELYDYPPTEEQIANFGGIIEDYYAYTDRALGQLFEAYGENATYLVISDHGMKPVNRNKRFNPDDPPANINSGEHQDAPDGVLFAAGPAIRKTRITKRPSELSRADLPSVGSVLDITPTLLAMLRIPVGQDMDGRILTNLFRDGFDLTKQPAPLRTHDTPQFLSARGISVDPHPDEQERLEQLRSLGYIGGSQKKELQNNGG